MKKTRVRALFKQIQAGQVPIGLTPERLGEITDETGQTGLHVCAKFGHYPLVIKNSDLADCWAIINDRPTSALHFAALYGHLLPETTAKKLADCIDEKGFSALRVAAEAGHLPNDTTANDLLADVFGGVLPGQKTTVLQILADIDPTIKDQISMVLANTTSSGAEMKQIAETLQKKNPAAVNLWVARQMEKQQAFRTTKANAGRVATSLPAMHTIRQKISELSGFDERPQLGSIARITAWTEQQFDFLPKPFHCQVSGDEVAIQYPKESETNLAEGLLLATGADEHAKAGNNNHAIGAYERALELVPSLHRVRLNLAMAHFTLGDVEKGWGYLRQFLQLYPKDVDGLITAANELARRKIDHPRAADIFAKVLELDPQNVPALTGLANIHLELNMFEDAISLCERAINIDPARANAYYVQAQAYQGLNQPNKSIRALKQMFERAKKQDARCEPVFTAARQLYDVLCAGGSQSGSPSLT